VRVTVPLVPLVSILGLQIIPAKAALKSLGLAQAAIVQHATPAFWDTIY